MILHTYIFAEEARFCYVEAERRDPNDARWPYFLANLQMSRNPDEAVPALRRAVDLAGDAPDAPRLRLADLLLQMDDRAGAATLYRQLLDRDPGHARGHLGLARLALLDGDLATARTHLPPALASPLARKAALALRAEVSAQAGDPAAADRDLAEVRRLPDDRPWPDPWMMAVARLKSGERQRRGLAVQLVETRHLSEGVAILLDLTRDYPENAVNWVELGYALMQARDWAKAETALRKAVDLDPNLARGWFYLGFAQHERGDRRAAAGSFRTAVAKRPDYAVAHFHLGVTLQEESDVPGAVAAFRDALRCQPRQALAHARLGELLARTNRVDEAKDHLRQAVELNPADEKSKQLLADLSNR